MKPFAAYVLFGAGWAASAWLLPGRWLLILLLGAGLGFASMPLLMKLEVRNEPTRDVTGGGMGWGMFEANFLVIGLALISAVLLWSLFGAGTVYALAARRPALAAGMVNTLGLMMGLTAYLGVNRGKLVSK